MTTLLIRRGEETQRISNPGIGRTPMDDGVEIGIKAMNDQNCQEKQKLRERHGIDPYMEPSERIWSHQ